MSRSPGGEAFARVDVGAGAGPILSHSFAGSERSHDGSGSPVQRSRSPTHRALYESEGEVAAPWLDVTDNSFNAVMGVIVVCNAAVIALETDYGSERFQVFEHAFVATFLAEAVLRFCQLGRRAYLSDAWNVFDLALLTLGIFDLWILPLTSTSNRGQVNLSHFTTLRLLRLLRLVRILRIIRLFSIFNILGLLKQTLGKAFQVVMSLVLLVGLLDYVLAVFLTQVAGHNADLWAHEEQRISVVERFGTIGASMRTLFQVMTLDEWSDIIDTLSERFPGYVVCFCFVSYIVFASYTLTCLITAVLGSQLMQQHQENRDARAVKSEEHRLQLAEDIRRHITKALGKQVLVQASELRDLVLSWDWLKPRLQECDLQVGRDRLPLLVDQLSIDGCVSADYFVEKLLSLSGNARASEVVDVKHLSIHGQLHLMTLQAKVSKLEKHMRQEMEKLHKKVESITV